ncbi:MAG: PIN domain-containing protein [Acidimicrobiales bacterium]
MTSWLAMRWSSTRASLCPSRWPTRCSASPSAISIVRSQAARIVAEAADAIVEIHPDIPPEQIQRRFATMDDTFEDARVDGWEDLEDTVTLPDPDDRHVVAAAVRGRADAIVTANVRHYPVDILGPLNIEVIHPDDFLLDQLDLAPRIVLEVLRVQAAHTRRPPLTPIDLITRLAKSGVPGFADEAGRLI